MGKDGLTKAEGSETDEDGLKVGRPSSRGGQHKERSWRGEGDEEDFSVIPASASNV